MPFSSRRRGSLGVEGPTPWTVRADDVAQRSRGRRRPPWVQAFTSVSAGQVLKTRHGKLPQKCCGTDAQGLPQISPRAP